MISDQAPSITSAVSGLVCEGLLGAGFAIVVILLFLFSIRSTLLTAISIPLSKDSIFIGAPLAITVIGGLASSTILTLLLVPALYVMIEGRRDRKSLAKSKPVEEQETSKQEVVQGA